MSYACYLAGVQMPTPAKLTVKIKNKNKTLILLNEGEINFLRTPGLTEIMVPFTFGGRAGTGGDQPVHALWKRESNTGQSRGTAPQVGEDHGGVQGITVRK